MRYTSNETRISSTCDLADLVSVTETRFGQHYITQSAHSRVGSKMAHLTEADACVIWTCGGGASVFTPICTHTMKVATDIHIGMTLTCAHLLQSRPSVMWTPAASSQMHDVCQHVRNSTKCIWLCIPYLWLSGEGPVKTLRFATEHCMHMQASVVARMIDILVS